MFRLVHRITPRLRSLLWGAMTASALTLASASMVGCADENDPQTHVKRLSDPATLPGAVSRLVQFFEDKMTQDGKNREGPNVKPLLDQIVEPMTQVCVAGNLDERTTSKLIKFLSDARDPRGEACLIKALKDYKPDSTEEDIRWAVRGIGAMKSKAAAGPLMDVFTKLQVSKPKASVIYLDVHDAMIAINDPSWEGQLITLLSRPIHDLKDVPTLKNEVYWQTTAAKLLGLQKSEKAIEPLLKVMLSPTKADIAYTAMLALVKIGKPAIQPAIAILQGDAKELIDYSKTENLKLAGEKPTSEQKKAAENAHISAAALILGTIGREETATPLLAAVEKLDKSEDVPRAIIARELSKVPKTPQTVKAFQDAYEATPITLSIPPGMGAREAMLEAAGLFFDAELTPWIVKTAIDARGYDGDVAPVRDVSLATALKLMTPDQIEVVDKLYETKQTGADGKPSTVGKAFEKEYKNAKELLTTCKTNVDCYISKLAEPASQAKDTQFQGIKCAYMIGILGSPEVRAKLIEIMPKISNAAVKFVAVSVIDYHSPKGDLEVANKLQKLVDDADESKDAEKMSSYAPFKTVIYRLQARAQ